MVLSVTAVLVKNHSSKGLSRLFNNFINIPGLQAPGRPLFTTFSTIGWPKGAEGEE